MIPPQDGNEYNESTDLPKRITKKSYRTKEGLAEKLSILLKKENLQLTLLITPTSFELSYIEK
jgi:hypothetical protein